VVVRVYCLYVGPRRHLLFAIYLLDVARNEISFSFKIFFNISYNYSVIGDI
jgi:hypothetical protein